MNLNVAILPAAELAAVPARGRAVPLDPIAEPAARPVYPRYVRRSKASAPLTSQVRRLLAAEAARYRIRASQRACDLREARLAARHESARIGGA